MTDFSHLFEDDEFTKLAREQNLNKSDFDPADIFVPEGEVKATTVTGEQPKKRGRKPLPRDEHGNIIRDGKVSYKRTTGKPSIENRAARKKEIVATLVQINPYICQGMCMIGHIPQQYAMGVHLGDPNDSNFGKTFVTPIGMAMCLPDGVVELYGEAGARFVETPLGQKLMSNVENIAPFGFVALAAVATTVWAIQLPKVMKSLKPIIDEMQAKNQPSATETNITAEDIFAPV
ncbi:MAG: hypothetical protein ACRDFB_05460 [Rhabdochlamydiaceae bacterium]